MGLVMVIAGWLSIGGRHLNRSSHEGNTLPSIRRSGLQVDEGRLPPLTDPGLGYDYPPDCISSYPIFINYY
jgi:hypothetical protein